MTVKIIPITPEYREGWDMVFRKISRDSSTGRDSVCSGDDVGSSPTPGSKVNSIQDVNE